MKSFTITFIVLFLTVTTAFANNNNKTDNTANTNKEVAVKTTEKTTAAPIANVLLLDEVPKMDKDACQLDVQFDLVINGLNVEFQNKSQGSYSDVEWMLGDGSISSDSNIKHTYNKAGIYYFNVMLFDKQSGCMDFVAGQYFVGNNNSTQEVTFTHKDLGENKILNMTK